MKKISLYSRLVLFGIIGYTLQVYGYEYLGFGVYIGGFIAFTKEV
jgi:hypothetical protein